MKSCENPSSVSSRIACCLKGWSKWRRPCAPGNEDDALCVDLPPRRAFTWRPEYPRRFASDKQHWGQAGKELDDLLERFPVETSSGA